MKLSLDSWGIRGPQEGDRNHALTFKTLLIKKLKNWKFLLLHQYGCTGAMHNDGTLPTAIAVLSKL